MEVSLETKQKIVRKVDRWRNDSGDNRSLTALVIDTVVECLKEAQGPADEEPDPPGYKAAIRDLIDAQKIGDEHAGVTLERLIREARAWRALDKFPEEMMRNLRFTGRLIELLGNNEVSRIQCGQFEVSR